MKGEVNDSEGVIEVIGKKMWNKNWNCIYLKQMEAHMFMFYTGQASCLMVSVLSTDELTEGMKSLYTTGLFAKVLQTQFVDVIE